MSFGQNITAERRAALARVEAMVQVVERREVPSPGRATIYMEKENQARACLATTLSEVQSDDFPLVLVDMETDELSNMHEAAQAIVDAADMMRRIARPVEKWRRTRNRAIRSATTVSEVRAVDLSQESLDAAIAAALST